MSAAALLASALALALPATAQISRQGLVNNATRGDLVIAARAGGGGPSFHSRRVNGGRSVLDPQGPVRNSIRACTHRWRPAKCSRTVSITILGETMSCTANRGAPPCGDNTQQTDRSRDTEGNPIAAHTGTFTVRIYGKLCTRSTNTQNCHQFGPPPPGGGLSTTHT